MNTNHNKSPAFQVECQGNDIVVVTGGIPNEDNPYSDASCSNETEYLILSALNLAIILLLSQTQTSMCFKFSGNKVQVTNEISHTK